MLFRSPDAYPTIEDASWRNKTEGSDTRSNEQIFWKAIAYHEVPEANNGDGCTGVSSGCTAGFQVDGGCNSMQIYVTLQTLSKTLV